MTQNSNSVKRKLFCYFFLKLGNIHEAGIKAGFPEKDAYIEGIKTDLQNITYPYFRNDKATAGKFHSVRS